MKTKFTLIERAARLVLLSAFTTLYVAQPSTGHAQGTAFTYQGRLNDGLNPAHGTYDFRFKLFVDALGNAQAGSTVLTNGVPVTNGLFTVTIDFGAGIFNGSNYWLEVDVKTNLAGGYSALMPLQAVTPAPYAIFANTASNISGTVSAGQLSGSVSSANLSGTYGNAVNFSNAANSFSGNGGSLANVNAATLGGLGADQFWKTTGNSNTVAGVNFLGSADSQPLELKVNGTRALRIEPNTNGAPNMIGGAPINFVDPGIVGATIAGGGVVAGDFYLGVGSNHVSAIFGTIGGGRINTVAADHGFIGGGYINIIQPFAFDSVIGGGAQSTIQTNAFDSVIAGGWENMIQTYAADSAIGGGANNTIQASSYYATIAGGNQNTIAQGALNSTISGGQVNTVSAPNSTIGGGEYNTAGTNSYFVTIGGGGYHNIGTNSSSTTISGGYENSIGNNTRDSAVGGGSYNNIGMNSSYSTIAGGHNNYIGDYATATAIGGGFANSGYGSYAVVPGGYNNIAAGGYSFAAGTTAQANHTGAFVWSDNSGGSFSSTASNQFSVRATGGVRFVTSGAGMTVDGYVGIGTTSPQAALHVRGADGAQFTLQNSANNSSWYISDDVHDNLVFQPNTIGEVGGYIYRGDGSYHQNSDVRLKRDITAIGGVLDRVLQLRPVSYHFRNAREGSPLTLGLIAQEVEPLFPEVVGERAGMKSLAYSELVPVTIGAIQELNQKVEAGGQTTEIRSQRSEERIQKLEAENAELKQRLERLEALEIIVHNQKAN